MKFFSFSLAFASLRDGRSSGPPTGLLDNHTAQLLLVSVVFGRRHHGSPRSALRLT